MGSAARSATAAAVLATLTAVAASVGLAATDGVSGWKPPADCHAVKFVAMRGSGDTSSALGVIATTISRQLEQRARRADLDFAAIGIPYTAVGIQFQPVMPLNYWLSERQGRNMLRAYIREQVRDCPSEQLAVEGYSQGAHAVGDVFSRKIGGLDQTELAHVKAVELIADPRFNSHEPYDSGSFRHGRNGLLGARSPGDLASVANRLRAWCHKDDIVCQGPGNTGQHGQQGYLRDYQRRFVDFVWSKIHPPTAAEGSGPAKRSVVLPLYVIAGVFTKASSARPTWIIFGADGRTRLLSLVWSTWGGKTATGHATYEVDSGAAGSPVLKDEPVTVLASDIQRCDGKLTYTFLTAKRGAATPVFLDLRPVWHSCTPLPEQPLPTSEGVRFCGATGGNPEEIYASANVTCSTAMKVWQDFPPRCLAHSSCSVDGYACRAFHSGVNFKVDCTATSNRRIEWSGSA